MRRGDVSSLIGVFIGIAMLIFLHVKEGQCKARGGSYVRSIVWFKCLKRLEEIDP